MKKPKLKKFDSFPSLETTLPYGKTVPYMMVPKVTTQQLLASGLSNRELRVIYCLLDLPASKLKISNQNLARRSGAGKHLWDIRNKLVKDGWITFRQIPGTRTCVYDLSGLHKYLKEGFNDALKEYYGDEKYNEMMFADHEKAMWDELIKWADARDRSIVTDERLRLCYREFCSSVGAGDPRNITAFAEYANMFFMDYIPQVQ